MSAQLRISGVWPERRDGHDLTIVGFTHDKRLNGWESASFDECSGIPREVIVEAGSPAIGAVADAGEEVSVYLHADLFLALQKISLTREHGKQAIAMLVAIYWNDAHNAFAAQGHEMPCGLFRKMFRHMLRDRRKRHLRG
jgi:hypothetical protein